MPITFASPSCCRPKVTASAPTSSTLLYRSVSTITGTAETDDAAVEDDAATAKIAVAIATAARAPATQRLGFPRETAPSAHPDMPSPFVQIPPGEGRAPFTP